MAKPFVELTDEISVTGLTMARVWRYKPPTAKKAILKEFSISGDSNFTTTLTGRFFLKIAEEIITSAGEPTGNTGVRLTTQGYDVEFPTDKDLRTVIQPNESVEVWAMLSSAGTGKLQISLTGVLKGENEPDGG